MRNMSFALTEAAMRAQEKTVTRRLGWEFLRVGDFLQPVRKAMGLKKGETVQKIGGAIEVVSLKRERLAILTDVPRYGAREVELEGFPQLSAADFVLMFCRSHKCQPSAIVTRIEFKFCPIQEVHHAR